MRIALISKFILLGLMLILNSRESLAVCNPATAGTIADHVCGTGGCDSSIVPQRVIPGTWYPSPRPSPLAAETFDKVVNPMAACCGMGWAENMDAARKFDCVEARPSAAVASDFLSFYNEGAVADDMTTAGLTFPNQMFVLGRNGVPLNGFYNQKGARCNLATPRNPADQLTLYRTALTNMVVPVGATADNANCCNLVVFALERTCPTTPTVAGGTISISSTFGTTVRCTAAASMKLHFAVFDLCDSAVTRRTRFRVATSYPPVAGPSGTPGNVSSFPVDTIDVVNLVRRFYPEPSPSPAPSPAPSGPPPIPNPCPSPGMVEIPRTNGQCRLNTP